jgi:hypothetical protein
MKSRAKLRGLVSRVKSMTDKPAPVPPRPPLVLPPNFRDVTAERTGVIIGIVGVPPAGSKFSGQLTDGVVRTEKFRA